MSFFLNPSSTNLTRSGILKLNNLQYETPLIFQYSRNGSIPHLDWNLCQSYLNDGNAPVLAPFPTSFGMAPYLKSLQMDMRQFCCIPNSRATFVSIKDPLNPSPSGYNCKAGISMWTSAGRTVVKTNDFISVINMLKPDSYQSLCDSDTPIDASRKRISHSVKRTIEYLDEILAQRDEFSPFLFGSIEGGCDMSSRLVSVKSTRERAVEGFVFEGIFEQIRDNQKLNDLVKAITFEIPQEKPRAMFGCLRPEEIHSMIEMGFDLFDSSYATSLAEDGKALIIALEDMKTTSSEIDLKDASFKEDFSIISKDCVCYSCTKGFTKAYLNHLLNCKEMTSSVLLMLHNLHVLYDWINKLKNSH